MSKDETREYMESLMGGYDEDALQAAFNKVKDQEDWKAAIDKTVEVDGREEVELICFAVNFYTGTPCDACDEPEGKATFKAIGYRMGPAGDH